MGMPFGAVMHRAGRYFFFGSVVKTMTFTAENPDGLAGTAMLMITYGRTWSKAAHADFHILIGKHPREHFSFSAFECREDLLVYVGIIYDHDNLKLESGDLDSAFWSLRIAGDRSFTVQ